MHTSKEESAVCIHLRRSLLHVCTCIHTLKKESSVYMHSKRIDRIYTCTRKEIVCLHILKKIYKSHAQAKQFGKKQKSKIPLFI